MDSESPHNSEGRSVSFGPGLPTSFPASNSLLDYFAAKAMQAYLEKGWIWHEIPGHAYKMAEREKRLK